MDKALFATKAIDIFVLRENKSIAFLFVPLSSLFSSSIINPLLFLHDLFLIIYVIF